MLPRNWTLPGISLALLLGAPALAEPAARPRNPDSIFFISRSENRNQVHYGIRLGEDCRPVGAVPVYAYWRMVEKGDGVVEPLLGIEGPAYGLADGQQVTATPEGWRVRVQLRAFADRPVEVAVTRRNGACVAQAWTQLKGATVQLDNIFVRTSWPLSIDFLRLTGVDADGRTITELVRP